MILLVASLIQIVRFHFSFVFVVVDVVFFCCYFLHSLSPVFNFTFIVLNSRTQSNKCYYLALCTRQLHLFHIIIVPGVCSVLPTLQYALFCFVFIFSPFQPYFNMHGNHVAEGGRVGRIALSLSLYYALPS